MSRYLVVSWKVLLSHLSKAIRLGSLRRGIENNNLTLFDESFSTCSTVRMLEGTLQNLNIWMKSKPWILYCSLTNTFGLVFLILLMKVLGDGRKVMGKLPIRIGVLDSQIMEEEMKIALLRYAVQMQIVNGMTVNVVIMIMPMLYVKCQMEK